MDQPFARAIGAVERSVEAVVREGQEMRKVCLARTYPTSADDLWEAVTHAERLPRWFLPVSGDLTEGGHYQFEGNAGGKILLCKPPKHLSVTWEFGGGISWLEVFFTEETPGQACLRFEHLVPVDDHWAKFGSGATGVGWDLTFLGLGTRLGVEDSRYAHEEWMSSEEGKAFMRLSSDAWCLAQVTNGESEDTARQQARQTANFYTGTTG